MYRYIINVTKTTSVVQSIKYYIMYAFVFIYENFHEYTDLKVEKSKLISPVGNFPKGTERACE